MHLVAYLVDTLITAWELQPGFLSEFCILGLVLAFSSKMFTASRRIMQLSLFPTLFLSACNYLQLKNKCMLKCPLGHTEGIIAHVSCPFSAERMCRVWLEHFFTSRWRRRRCLSPGRPVIGPVWSSLLKIGLRFSWMTENWSGLK